MIPNFEWDLEKARANWQKHHVSFAEAVTVFGDWAHATILDELHSTDEDRFITIGMSERGRLIAVSHTENEDRTRIISARPATRHEERQYEESPDRGR